MPNNTQDGRLLSVTSDLGKDVLLLTSFTGREEVSRVFAFDLEMLSENDAIKPTDVIAKKVTVCINPKSGEPRYFHGIVSRFSFSGKHDRLSIYRAQIVPWLWFLSKSADCRIFQNMTVPDIVKKVFSDMGFSDFQFSLKKTYNPWEYCVQYRETHLNFISRLLEHEGIFYFIKHENGKHTVVVADHVGAYQDCVEKKVQYESTETSSENDLVFSWEHSYEMISGKWVEGDYNFITPGTDLTSKSVSTKAKWENVSKFEKYDYPGEYEKKSEADAESQVRMEEEEVTHDVVRGQGYCRSFFPGGKFTMDKHFAVSESGKGYVLTSVTHRAVSGGYSSGNDAGAGDDYYNSFSAIPDSTVIRPARITPKSIVNGLQTAVVVGPKGEEIFTDKYGRIKVQFFWDRQGKRDENSSCFVRVAQASAGRQWGSFFLPRIGQEVVVEFLEGDPDRPLITGSVYNDDQMPHYTLPDDQTRSYIKTNSTKGGDGHNELRFEDKKDKEQIYVHAQKNMDVRVLNDSMERILGSRHQIIGSEKDGEKSGDQNERVYQDKQLNVKRNQIEHIEGNYQLNIGNGAAEDGGKTDIAIEKQLNVLIGEQGCQLTIQGDKTEKIAGARSLTVGGDRLEKVEGAQSLTVVGDQKEKVASHSLETTGDQNVKVGGSHALESAMAIHIKAGMTLVLEAGMQLSLKVGGNFIDIGPAGVAITGTMVMINSGGAAGSGAGCSPQPPDTPNDPTDVVKAAPAEPTMADETKTGKKSC